MAQNEENVRIPTRVLIVEDHFAMIQGVQRLLEPFSPQVTLVGEAANAEEAIERVRELSPDLVLLDLRLPQGPLDRAKFEHGIGVIRQIKDIAPHTRVLILSGYFDGDDVEGPQVLFEAMKAGAHGYLSKNDPFSGEELVYTIQKIMAGQAIYGPRIAELMRQAFIVAYQNREPVLQVDEPLSSEEERVLEMHTEGKPIREIDEHLGTNSGTASSILSRILTKLHSSMDPHRGS